MKAKEILKCKKSYTPISIGKAYILKKRDYTIKNRDVETVDKEVDKLIKAIEMAKNDISFIQSKIDKQLHKDIYAIFDTYHLLLGDSYYIDDAIEEIKKTHKNAAYVVYNRMLKMLNFFDSVDDPIIKQRGEDIQFLSEKVLFYLLKDITKVKDRFYKKILIVEKISPFDLILYHYQGIAGVVIQSGDMTSHTAIIAHGLNLPFMIGVSNIFDKIDHDDEIIIDGYQGYIYISPENGFKESYILKQSVQKEQFNIFKKRARGAIKTRDQKSIPIYLNLEFFDEITQIDDIDFEGVGLFRTEFLFYNQEVPPNFNEQRDTYKKILSNFPDKTVTIRTFDYSEDKTPSALKKIKQHNPSLGVRGIRYANLNNILEEQFKALIEASEFGKLNILFPMVTTVDEVKNIKKIEKKILSTIDNPSKLNYNIGIMVETPASVYLLEYIHDIIDFVSFGTNDMMQFFLAADRSNNYLNELNNPFEPTFIKFLKFAVSEAHKYQLYTSICGEIGSYPLYLPILLGIGFDSISVTPATVPILKNMIPYFSIFECEKLVENGLKISNSSKVEDFIYQFIKNKGEELVEIVELFSL